MPVETRQRSYSQENLAPQADDSKSQSDLLNSDDIHCDERNAMSQRCDNASSFSYRDDDTESEEEEGKKEAANVVAAQPMDLTMFRNYLKWRQ